MSEGESGGPPDAKAAAEDAAVARVVARLSSEYVLRALQLSIEAFGDVRAGMLVQTIHAANLAHVTQFAEEDLGRRAAGPGAIFPDDRRRPISIGRLAASTGLPFETVRRTVRRLIDSGTCARAEDGVIVPSTTDRRPEVVAAVIANVAYVRRLLRDLHAVGFIENASSATRRADAQDTLEARLVARVSEEYLLRAVQLMMDSFGDIRDAIVAQTIVTANTSHLDARGGDGRRYAGIDAAPPDEIRRPISVAGVAQSLGLPFETTRRHVRRLLDGGACARRANGLIVPKAALSRPQVVRAALANVGYVRRFARELLATGV